MMKPIQKLSRQNASQQNLKVQNYNKERFDKKHKQPYKYKVGDLVMVINRDVTPGINKKLLPKYRGLYEVKKVLNNDRYVITDVHNFQISQKPFEGIFGPENLKLWLTDNAEKIDINDVLTDSDGEIVDIE